MDGYFSVPTTTFSAGVQCEFDVFVKVGEGHFVKILLAGDAFPPQRVQSFLDKGVTEFFLHNSSHEAWIEFSAKRGGLKRLHCALTLGDDFLRSVQQHGLSESGLRSGKLFVASVQEVVRSTTIKDDEYFVNFLRSVADCEHGAGVAFLVGVLGKSMGFEMDKRTEDIGVAALFHDVGMLKLDPRFRKEDEPTHPKLGADLLRQFPQLDNTIIQAVLHHHVRRSGQNPALLKDPTAVVNPVAEMIGICEDFLTLVQRHRTEPKLNIRVEMERNVYKGFSYMICQAFRSKFFTR